MTEPAGSAQHLRCPYHGWTYSLEGELKGTPDFAGVCDFDRAQNGLVPVEVAEWESWVFIKISKNPCSLPEFLTTDFIEQIEPLQLRDLHWFERRHYNFDCNWKVFWENYSECYHCPGIHPELCRVMPLYKEGLGLDSIGVLEIALAVSKTYGVRLRSDDDANQKIFGSLRSLNRHILNCRAR